MPTILCILIGATVVAVVALLDATARRWWSGWDSRDGTTGRRAALAAMRPEELTDRIVQRLTRAGWRP